MERHSHLNVRVIPRELLISRLLLNPILELGEFRIPLRNLIFRYIDEEEDESDKEETSENHNFMQEKNMNFRLYPLYINWKKVEHNKSGYYRVFSKYGYLGASVFSNLKEKYPNLDSKNFLLILAEFISDNLFMKNNETNNTNDTANEKIKEFFEKLPDIKDLCELLAKKVIMMKEIPLLILILKLYEIKFFIEKNDDELITVLKNEYLLMSYLTDDEYSNIYNNHYKGKISKIFKKLVNSYGKNYTLPKAKGRFLNHIKSIYKSCKINS